MTQKQHRDPHRKLALRRRLLADAAKIGAPKNGPAYVPFIGDGDLAVELYQGRAIYGVDIDAERIKIAETRLPTAVLSAQDADSWPFQGLTLPSFNLADFDAYSEPYASFRAFWENANKAETMLLFFTDGHRQGITRTGHWHKPDGTREIIHGMNAKRMVVSRYYKHHIIPWFTEYIRPYKVIKETFYLRGMSMLYWGAIVQNVGK